MNDEKSLLFSRIVQLGWAIGESDLAAPIILRTKLVKPVGFEIAAKATRFHQISHEAAMRDGQPLAEVLKDFMKDVKEAFRKGGRVVAHQIEFDYKIIYEELGRCGLAELQAEWREVAMRGYCTMNPVLGKWLLHCSNEEIGPRTTMNLANMLHWLLPDQEEIVKDLVAKRHNAGADAQMTRLAYVAVLTRIRANLTPGDHV